MSDLNPARQSQFQGTHAGIQAGGAFEAGHWWARLLFDQEVVGSVPAWAPAAFLSCEPATENFS